MHDDHAAQLKQGAADAGDVACVDRYFSKDLPHDILLLFLVSILMLR